MPSLASWLQVLIETSTLLSTGVFEGSSLGLNVDLTMSIKLSPAQAAIVKRALSLRYYQHVIAAYFGVNQGRVSEIKSGKHFAGISMANSLPPDFPAR